MAKKKDKSGSKSKGSSKRKRRGIDFDEAAKKQKELADRSGGEFHELKVGWNYFYICPPWADEIRVLWREVQQHGLGLVCPPNSGYDKPCLICKERKKALKKGDSDFADNFRLSSRGFMNAIRKEDIKSRGPVKLLGVSSNVFEQIVDHVTDEKIDISDPEAAVIVAIKRKGKGKATRYPSVKFSDPINIAKYITDDVYEALNDLDTIKAVQPASEKAQRTAIRKFIKGDADEDDFDDDEDLSGDDGFDDEGDGFENDSDEDELFDDPDTSDEDDEDSDDLDDDDDDSTDDEDDSDDDDDDGDSSDDEDDTDEDDDLADDDDEEEKPKKKRKAKSSDRKKAKKGSSKGKRKRR